MPPPLLMSAHQIELWVISKSIDKTSASVATIEIRAHWHYWWNITNSLPLLSHKLFSWELAMAKIQSSVIEFYTIRHHHFKMPALDWNLSPQGHRRFVWEVLATNHWNPSYCSSSTGDDTSHKKFFTPYISMVEYFIVLPIYIAHPLICWMKASLHLANQKFVKRSPGMG